MVDITDYFIKTGLIQLDKGDLNINNLDVKDIIIQGQSVIQANEGTEKVNIIGSKFENVERQITGNGSIIEGYMNNNNGKIIVSSTTFKNCKLDTSTGLGGAIYLKIQLGEIELSEVTMNQCSAKNGGAIYSSLIEGSSMIIKDSSSFSECKSIAGNGGAMYIDIDLTSQSKFELIDTTCQSCQSKDSTPPSSSTSPFGFGGAIFITAQGQYDPLKNGKALK
ncbi:MAG: hypothetical protein EZS28_050293, partial [Streblomastix strix]